MVDKRSGQSHWETVCIKQLNDLFEQVSEYIEMMVANYLTEVTYKMEMAQTQDNTKVPDQNIIRNSLTFEYIYS